MRWRPWSWTPRDWPPSDARRLALDITRGAPLQPLFDLNQSRAKANLVEGQRVVGEWSLDEVRAVVGKRPAFYYELEIELGPDGRESDLERVAEALLGEHGLQPEPCSKFVRALEMLRLRGTAVEGGLSDEERRHLTAYEAGADAELARRAAAVLSWASGLPTRRHRRPHGSVVGPDPVLDTRVPRKADGHLCAGRGGGRGTGCGG